MKIRPNNSTILNLRNQYSLLAIIIIVGPYLFILTWLRNVTASEIHQKPQGYSRDMEGHVHVVQRVREIHDSDHKSGWDIFDQKPGI